MSLSARVEHHQGGMSAPRRHTIYRPLGFVSSARDQDLEGSGIPTDEDMLLEAFGAGKGKHAGQKRRRHSNKYASGSKVAALDPWEEQLRRAEAALGEAEALELAAIEEMREKKRKRREARGEVVYPDEEDIDPYDPSTFGYVEVRWLRCWGGERRRRLVHSLAATAHRRPLAQLTMNASVSLMACIARDYEHSLGNRRRVPTLSGCPRALRPVPKRGPV